MKVTNEHKKDYILDRCMKAILIFVDGVEVVLDQISMYRLDLNKTGLSSINLTNCFFNNTLLEHWNKSKVNLLHLEIRSIDPVIDNQEITMLDISCLMDIVNLDIDEDNVCPDMKLLLEGVVL